MEVIFPDLCRDFDALPAFTAKSDHAHPVLIDPPKAAFRA
jgi:hypothetical protein